MKRIDFAVAALLPLLPIADAAEARESEDVRKNPCWLTSVTLDAS